MHEINAGKIISNIETGAQYLVLWVAPKNEYGYWYDLNSRSRKPKRFMPSDITNECNTHVYEATDQIIVNNRPENTLSESEKAHRDKIWGIMQAAVEYEPEIYEHKTRTAILRMIAEDNHMAPNNLYRYLDRYWRSGKTKNAFIPDFHKCGGKGVHRQGGDKKIGRKAYGEKSAGKRLTETDRANFAAAVKSYYLNRKKLTLTAVYEKLLSDYYSMESKDSPGQKQLLPPDELPSIRQFRFWYGKNRNTITEHKKRSGESSFELTGRSVLGKSDFGLMGPGAQFQIDATVGDIYLVSQFDRRNLIGRPVLYFIIDAFSRMVTGMSVGLEGPSWSGIAGAITNMATDKVLFCKEYGIEITGKDWPCKHVPASLVGDRGELISKNADNLVNMLGIRIVNTPPYRADLKGIVEQHFRTINTNSVALLPGSVKPDMSKRGGRDYRFDAKLDIRQFTQIIIKCVLHYNNHHCMDYFEPDEAMKRDRVEPIPAKLWDWGIRNYSGALRSFSDDTVRLAVMPVDRATVTGKGIRFKGLFYSSERAVGEAWFEKARSGKTWAVTVSYDPRDMANIYAWNHEDKSYDICTLLDWNNKNAGKCLDEIVYEQRNEKIIAKQLKISEMEAKINLNADIEAIVAEALSMGKGLQQKSKKDRVSKIKENRRNERDAIRNTNNIGEAVGDSETPDKPETPIKNDAAESEISPTLRMIKERMEARQKNG